MLHKWFFSPWSNPLQSCPDWRHLITEWDVLYFSYVRIAPWLPYVCSASWKKLGSCVFQGLYWSPICFPCVWKKKYIVLEKVWKKSWILDPKICTNPVCWSYLDKTLHFLNSFNTWNLRATLKLFSRKELLAQCLLAFNWVAIAWNFVHRLEL